MALVFGRGFGDAAAAPIVRGVATGQAGQSQIVGNVTGPSSQARSGRDHFNPPPSAPAAAGVTRPVPPTDGTSTASSALQTSAGGGGGGAYNEVGPAVDPRSQLILGRFTRTQVAIAGGVAVVLLLVAVVAFRK